jgi:hypothetical protein
MYFLPTFEQSVFLSFFLFLIFYYLYPLLLIKAVRYVCFSVRTSVLFVFGALRLIFPSNLPNDGPVHKMPSTCALALAGPAVTTVKLLSEWCLSWIMASPSKSFPNNFF